MPFTPYHFGPAALIGLPLKRWIDIPVFVLVNVAIDLEPGAVMVFNLDYPLHGYIHTFLFGGLVGVVWGVIAYILFRRFFAFLMRFFGLPYQPTLLNMTLSGLFGGWLHILFDSVLYKEMNPFWPMLGNPLHAVVRYRTVFLICEVSLIAAVVIYPALAWHNYRKAGKSSV
jgi:membrane-bound metal-dependent hydrolase YbcI (DUF457 family)